MKKHREHSEKQSTKVKSKDASRKSHSERKSHSSPGKSREKGESCSKKKSVKRSRSPTKSKTSSKKARISEHKSKSKKSGEKSSSKSKKTVPSPRTQRTPSSDTSDQTKQLALIDYDSAYNRAKRFLESDQSEYPHQSVCKNTCTAYEENLDSLQHRLELMMTDLLHQKFYTRTESKAYHKFLDQRDEDESIGRFLAKYDKKFAEKQQRLKQENLDIKNKLFSLTSSLLLSSIDPKYLNVEHGTDLLQPSTSVLPISPHLTASRTAYDLNAVGMSFRAFPSSFETTLPVKPPDEKPKIIMETEGKSKKSKLPRNKRKSAKQRKIEEITQIEIEKYLAFANKRYRKMLKYVDKLVFTADTKQYELFQNYLKHSLDTRIISKRLASETEAKVKDEDSMKFTPSKRPRRNSSKASVEDSKKRSVKSKKEAKCKASSCLETLFQHLFPSLPLCDSEQQEFKVHETDPYKDIDDLDSFDQVPLVKDLQEDIECRKEFFQVFSDFQKYYGRKFTDLTSKSKPVDSKVNHFELMKQSSLSSEVDGEVSPADSNHSFTDPVIKPVDYSLSINSRLDKMYKSINCDPEAEKHKVLKNYLPIKCERKLRSSWTNSPSRSQLDESIDESDDEEAKKKNDSSETIIDGLPDDLVDLTDEDEGDDEEDEEEEYFLSQFSLFDDDREDAEFRDYRFPSRTIDAIFNPSSNLTKSKLFSFGEKECKLFEKYNTTLLKSITEDVKSEPPDHSMDDNSIVTECDDNDSAECGPKIVQLTETILNELRPVEEQNRMQMKSLAALTRKEIKLQEMETKMLSMDFEVVDLYHQYLSKNRRYTKKERRHFLKKIATRRKYSKKTIQLLLKVISRSNLTKQIFTNYLEPYKESVPKTLKEFLEKTVTNCSEENCLCENLKQLIDSTGYDLSQVLL